VVRAISAGATHTLALTSTGQVLAWGINANGQLGDGTTTTSGTPVQTQLPPGVTVTAVAAGGELAGGEHSLALTSTGQVLAWGDNIAGELGDGTTTDRHVPVFTHLPQRARVRGLFGGCFHTLALTTAGQVLAWGDNQFGQLGNGTTTGSDLPVQVGLPSGTTVTAITAGCDHNLAATSSGHVLAWGIANDGELGTGTQPPMRKHPVQVRLPSGVTVTALGLGSEAFSSFAIAKKAP
jgi:alpha-tubulin suppressor-like RCC1 family protein